MRRALIVALALITVCAPTAIAEGDNDSVIVSASFKQDVDLSPYGLPVPGIHFEQDVAEALPLTSVNASTDEAMSSLPFAVESPLANVSSENGTPIVRSTLLPAGYFRMPVTGFYHNGTVDFGWLSGETWVALNDDIRSILSVPADASQAAMGNRFQGERQEAFAAMDPAFDALPKVDYEIDRRTVGIDVVTDKPAPLGVAFNESDIRSNRTHSDFALSPTEETEEPFATPELTPLSSSSAPDPTPPGPREPAPVTLTTHSVGGETRDPPNALVVAAVAGAMGMAVVLFLLYSLYHPKELLKNGVRAKIYATIEANPGITVARLAETAGVKHQTVSYHLKFLRKAGYIRDMECGNRRLHFIAGAGLSDADRTLLTISNDVTTMKILQLIEENPGIIKRDLAPRIGLTRTAGTWHVNKLVHLGLVTETREHGHCYLKCVTERQLRLRELLSRPDATPALPTAVNIPVLGPETVPARPTFTPGPT